MFAVWVFSSCLAGAVRDDSLIDLQIITVATKSQLNDVLSELKSGTRFDDVARRNSNHPTAAGGGYLGQMCIDDLSSELRRQVEGIPPGSMTHFLDPGLGYVVVRKLERKAANQAYSKQALRRGSRYLNQGKTQEAIKELKAALTHDPRSASAHLMLGYVYRLLGSYRMIGEAKGEFRQALSIDPDNTSARFHLARVYLDLGRIRKARETLEARLEITENTPELLSLLGEVNRQSGDLRLSIRQNESAVILDPDLAQAYYYLGLAHLDRGETEEALSRLDRAISLQGATSDMVLKAGSVYLQEGVITEGHRAASEGRRNQSRGSGRAPGTGPRPSPHGSTRLGPRGVGLGSLLRRRILGFPEVPGVRVGGLPGKGPCVRRQGPTGGRDPLLSSSVGARPRPWRGPPAAGPAVRIDR